MSTENQLRGRPSIVDDGSIIDAVTDVFWRRGFADTTITDLSAASGASRASLYKLYGDKHALLAAALRRYADRFDRRVAETLSETGDPVQAVRTTLQASAERLADPKAPGGCLRCRATLEVRGKFKEVDAALDQVNRAFQANMLRLLQADGRARPTDPATVHVLTAVVNGMVTLAEAGADRAALNDVVAGTVQIVQSGIGDARHDGQRW
ncbi:MAG: TetR/AcrR family transcriptional regulator [Pseudomonadota bacterium]